MIFHVESRFTTRGKSSRFEKFKERKVMMKNQSSQKIRYLRNDNGGEYKDGEFLKFYRDVGSRDTLP